MRHYLWTKCDKYWNFPDLFSRWARWAQSVHRYFALPHSQTFFVPQSKMPAGTRYGHACVLPYYTCAQIGVLWLTVPPGKINWAIMKFIWNIHSIFLPKSSIYCNQCFHTYVRYNAQILYMRTTIILGCNQQKYLKCPNIMHHMGFHFLHSKRGIAGAPAQ